MARSQPKATPKPLMIRGDRLLLALDVLAFPYEVSCAAVDGLDPHNPRGLSDVRIHDIARRYGAGEGLWIPIGPALDGLRSLPRPPSPEAEIDIGVWVDALEYTSVIDRPEDVGVFRIILTAIASGELTEKDFQERSAP